MNTRKISWGFFFRFLLFAFENIKTSMDGEQLKQSKQPEVLVPIIINKLRRRLCPLFLSTLFYGFGNWKERIKQETSSICSVLSYAFSLPSDNQPSLL